MEIINNSIDGGKPFDWGRTSENYARFRDIYPEEFYNEIVRLGLCIDGQSVLDLGTGTGVLPRNMYRYGARWTGTDISENQIKQARILSEGMNIDYYSSAAEQLNFPDGSFDVITACQCFWYFDHERIMPKLWKMLKPNGSILVLYMAWLPYEDRIAGASENLVLKFNPAWNGAGETMHPVFIPECYKKGFVQVYHNEQRLKVHFTKESWHGRMLACRGVGASLSDKETEQWSKEHIKLLDKIAPEEFDIMHYSAASVLRKNEKLNFLLKL